MTCQPATIDRGHIIEHIDCVVVGAGVVGLAVGRALALAGHEVVIIESADSIGTGVSSRNSEVIHAGIYYPTGSLKARLCVQGRDLLYRYCADHQVPHSRLGKLIVATAADQLDALHRLHSQAQANGVTDLRPLSAADVHAMEPEAVAVGGLLSPSTGIIDSAALMRALRRDAEDAGAAVALRSEVTGGRVIGGHIELDIAGVGSLRCDRVVNAAGLGAWAVAHGIDGVPSDSIPSRHLAKGSYFGLATGRAPFTHLVYPMPVDGGLGVHLTVDLGGAARFGPDVQWIDDVDYSVDADRAPVFADAVARYWPGVADRELVPAYAGVRPKVSGPGAPAADFVVQGPETHGVQGLINLFGIESPGLTSSFAIAELVAGLVT